MAPSTLHPSRFTWRLALAIFGGAALAGGAAKLALPRPVSNSPIPTNTIVERLKGRGLDVGTVWAESDFRHQIRIINATDKPVDVKHVVASCDCTSVTPATFSLPSRGSVDLAASIDLTRAHGAPAGRTRTKFDTQLTFVFDDDVRQALSLTGTLVKPLVIIPGSLALSAPVEFGERSRSETLVVWKDAWVSDVTARVAGPEGDVTELKDMASTASTTFEVRAKSDGLVGRFAFDVEISAHSKTGKSFGPFQIPVSGIVESDVDYSPRELFLVDGSQSTDDVSFWSKTGASCRVSEILDLPEHVEGDVLKDSDQKISTIRFRSKVGSGGKTGSAIVNVRVANSDYKVRIPVLRTAQRNIVP